MSVTTLWDTIEGYLAAENVELDDLRWAGRVLKVTVDAEGGVDVDRIADLARGLSRLLDDDDSLRDSYTLEVGSPGLERELRRPSHFRKAVGREVSIKTSQSVEGATHHRGILAASDGSRLIVTMEEGDRVIPLDAVTAARTVFTWGPAAKPGSSGRPKPGKKVQ